MARWKFLEMAVPGAEFAGLIADRLRSRTTTPKSARIVCTPSADERTVRLH